MNWTVSSAPVGTTTRTASAEPLCLNPMSLRQRSLREWRGGVKLGRLCQSTQCQCMFCIYIHTTVHKETHLRLAKKGSWGSYALLISLINVDWQLTDLWCPYFALFCFCCWFLLSENTPPPFHIFCHVRCQMSPSLRLWSWNGCDVLLQVMYDVSAW